MSRFGPRASGLRPRPASRGAIGVFAVVIAVAAACGGKKKAGRDEVGVTADAGETLRTARKLDANALAALAAVTISGHRVEVVRRAPDFGAIVHAPTTAGNVAATVTISACVTCKPLTAAAWEAERPSLTTLLAPGPTDSMTIDRAERGGWPVIEVRARRTLEGAPQAVVLALWNDGATQLIASCEQPGAADAEDLCSLLVEACALAYLPVLAPAH